MPTIDHHLRQLRSAHNAETVFGKIEGKTKPERLENLAAARKQLAKLLHEDKHEAADKVTAKEAFQLMEKWYPVAQQRINDGVYGDPGSIQRITLKTKSNTYTLKRMVATGDLATIYDAEMMTAGKTRSMMMPVPVVAKVVRNPANNALLMNEATRLTTIWEKADTKKIGPPRLLETFEAGNGGKKQRVNILTKVEGDLHTLNEVHSAYPELDLKHVAWMWNRMLANLHVTHSAGIVHGAVTPDNFLIVPETHYGTLIDYCHAVSAGTPLKTMISRWRDFYPPEVFEKKEATPALDLYMLATTVLYLLGGDPKTGSIARNVPAPVLGLIRAARIANPKKRTQSAEEMHHDLTDVMERIFGPKRFTPFTMPAAK